MKIRDLAMILAILPLVGCDDGLVVPTHSTPEEAQPGTHVAPGQGEKPSGGQGEQPSGGQGEQPSGGQGEQPSGGQGEQPSCGQDEPSDPICTVNAVKCFDRFMHTCTGTEWRADNECPFDCKPGVDACADCASGAKQCADNVASVCENGSWRTQTCDLGCDGDVCATPTPVNNNQPTRYLTDHDHPFSPITPYVLERMKQIAAKNSNVNENVFMKVGDSNHAYEFDGRFMRCFSDDTSQQVTLGDHAELSDAISYFQSGPIDSFNRNSLAAVGGQSTVYILSSYYDYPLKSEIEALHPRYAFFGHGANDIGNGSFTHKAVTYTSYGASTTAQGYSYSIQYFYRNITKSMDMMEAAGIIPMITNIVPRHDTPSTINYLDGAPAISSPSDYPTHMVAAFNAVIRGNAEDRQLPFLDLHAVFEPLPDEGISSDKAHSSYESGGSPCNFTASGMQYGVNNRNLYSITMLRNTWNAFANHVGGDAPLNEPFVGTGSPDDPFMITSLPFTHVADTSKSPYSSINSYACDSNTPEKGPEYFYKLVLPETKRLRLFALSSTTSVDADIHVLSDTPTGDQCVKRSDIMIQGTLSAGTYYVVVDTYDNASNAGKYLLGIVECDSDDHNCDPQIH